MLVTLDGISMPVNPLQPENAKFPMLVTLDGISMLVNSLQPKNTSFPMLVTLISLIFVGISTAPFAF